MNTTNSDNNNENKVIEPTNNVKKITPNHIVKAKLLRQKLREKKNKEEAEKNSHLQSNGQSPFQSSSINNINNSSSNNISIILPENENEKIDPLNFFFSTPSENRKKEDNNSLDILDSKENKDKKVINSFGNVINNKDNNIENDIKQNRKEEDVENVKKCLKENIDNKELPKLDAMKNIDNTKTENIFKDNEENKELKEKKEKEVIKDIKDAKEEPKNNIAENNFHQLEINIKSNENIPYGQKKDISQHEKIINENSNVQQNPMNQDNSKIKNGHDIYEIIQKSIVKENINMEKEISKSLYENNIVIKEKINEECQDNHYNNGNFQQELKELDNNMIYNPALPPNEEQKIIKTESIKIPMKEKEKNPEKILNGKEEIKDINNNNSQIIKEILILNIHLKNDIIPKPSLFKQQNIQSIKKSNFPKIVKKSDSNSSSSSDSDDDSLQDGEQQRLMNIKFAQEKLFQKNNKIPKDNIFNTKKKESLLNTEELLQKLFLDFDKTSELLELNEKKKQIMLKKMRRTLRRLSNLRIRNVNPQEEEKRNLINKKIEELKRLTGKYYEKNKKNVEILVLELKLPDFYFADDDDVKIIYEKKKISDNDIKPIMDIDFSSFMKP